MKSALSASNWAVPPRSREHFVEAAQARDLRDSTVPDRHSRWPRARPKHGELAVVRVILSLTKRVFLGGWWALRVSSPGPAANFAPPVGIAVRGQADPQRLFPAKSLRKSAYHGC